MKGGSKLSWVWVLESYGMGERGKRNERWMEGKNEREGERKGRKREKG